MLNKSLTYIHKSVQDKVSSLLGLDKCLIVKAEVEPWLWVFIQNFDDVVIYKGIEYELITGGSGDCYCITPTVDLTSMSDEEEVDEQSDDDTWVEGESTDCSESEYSDESSDCVETEDEDEVSEEELVSSDMEEDDTED